MVCLSSCRISSRGWMLLCRPRNRKEYPEYSFRFYMLLLEPERQMLERTRHLIMLSR